jgi:hypothetical protein
VGFYYVLEPRAEGEVIGILFRVFAFPFDGFPEDFSQFMGPVLPIRIASGPLRVAA